MLAIPLGTAAIIGVSQFDKITSSDVSNAGILGSVFSRFSSASLVEKKEAPASPSEFIYQQDPAPSAFENPSVESVVNPGEASQNTTNSLSDPAENSDNRAVGLQQPVQDITASAANTEDPFAIIVGAFKSKENAEKFIRELKQKGTEASIFDRSRGGLYRVTIGTFAIREEADQLLSSTRNSEFSGAWLLAK
jgi:cell division protein FtsN